MGILNVILSIINLTASIWLIWRMTNLEILLLDLDLDNQNQEIIDTELKQVETEDKEVNELLGSL